MRSITVLTFLVIPAVGLPAVARAEANQPDVVVHYAETYAAFPDIIRLQQGNLLMVAREGRIHMIDGNKAGSSGSCLPTVVGRGVNRWRSVIIRGPMTAIPSSIRPKTVSFGSVARDSARNRITTRT